MNSRLDKKEQAFADAVALRIFALKERPVLTAEEAMALVGKRSSSAFDEWLQRWAPRARCGQGVYAKERILHGLNRQARRVVEKKTRRNV